MKNEIKNKYLFCYFTGNEPENESVHLAFSEDGFHFTALNGNEKIINQTLGRKCCRDPFIFRDNNDIFHIIATDMRCYDGWNSNNSMVVWDSKDLINWENEHIIDFSQFSETKLADRVWAPEVLFDKDRDEYMIYWSHHNADSPKTVIWHAYTKDFKTLTTPPAILFVPKSGKDGIDADIIESSGKYYLYYKDEFKKTICYAVSEALSGPYHEPDSNLACCSDRHVEGNCIYKIYGTDTYAMIMDKYVDGGYFMQKTTDMIHFEPVDENAFSLNQLRPRHGSMLSISEEELAALKAAF